MRIGKIIGTVTLARCHPSLVGGVWRVCVPLSRDGLKGSPSGHDEPFVTYDELGAGVGALIAIAEGAEASAPFHPQQKPLDAYNAAILDVVDVH